MKEKQYLINRDEVFNNCNLNPSNRNYNCHHIVFKNDRKVNLVPSDFPLNDKRNLIPLPTKVHDELHEIINENPYFRRNIRTRVYLANMAYCGELDLVPDRIYYTDPVKMMRLKKV